MAITVNTAAVAKVFGNFLGITTIGIGLLILFVILTIAFISWRNYKKHNISVNIYSGSSLSTLRRYKDKGRLYIRTDTYQSSFHLWKRRIFIPNIETKTHILDSELNIMEVGNNQYVPMAIDFATGHLNPHLEVDLEFYADGIRRSLERKQGKFGFWDKHMGAVLLGGSMVVILFIFGFLFWNLKDVASALLAVADQCRIIKENTIITPHAAPTPT